MAGLNFLIFVNIIIQYQWGFQLPFVSECNKNAEICADPFHSFMLFLCVLSQLPKLPPANPFFSLSNSLQVTQRMEGLQRFLEAYVCQQLLISYFSCTLWYAPHLINLHSSEMSVSLKRLVFSLHSRSFNFVSTEWRFCGRSKSKSQLWKIVKDISLVTCGQPATLKINIFTAFLFLKLFSDHITIVLQLKKFK